MKYAEQRQGVEMGRKARKTDEQTDGLTGRLKTDCE